jgi:glucokinase
MMSSYFIGVDLGGTKIATSLTDSTGKLLSADLRPTLARDGAERVLQNIGDSIRAVMTGVEPGRIKGIGVASPGPVDIKEGMIVDAPNLGWQHFGLIKRLEDTFRIPSYTYPHTVRDLPIVLPALGDKCGTLGAAAVAVKAFEA